MYQCQLKHLTDLPRKIHLPTISRLSSPRQKNLAMYVEFFGVFKNLQYQSCSRWSVTARHANQHSKKHKEDLCRYQVRYYNSDTQVCERNLKIPTVFARWGVENTCPACNARRVTPVEISRGGGVWTRKDTKNIHPNTVWYFNKQYPFTTCIELWAWIKKKLC